MHTLLISSDVTVFLRAVNRLNRAGWSPNGEPIIDGQIYAQAFVKGDK